MTIELLAEIRALKEQLKQYKDIEEKLGIDLITLFKAKRNGIYVYDEEEDEIVFYDYDIDICFINRCKPRNYLEIVLNGRSITLAIKDYGKTWALTKEELIDEIH